MLRINRHMILRNNRHLLRVHLIPINKVTKKPSIRIREVERLMQDEIWIVAEIGMEGVVLKMRRI